MPYTGYGAGVPVDPYTQNQGAISPATNPNSADPTVRGPAAPVTIGGPTPTAGTSMLDQLTALFNAGAGSPNAALSQDAINSLMQSLGFSNEQLGLNTNQAQQAAGFAQQGLGLQNAGLGIQFGANERQAALLPQLHDLALQEFQAQEGSANRNADASLRNLNSALTPRGAFTSVMGNAQRGDISSQLSEQLSGIGRQRQQSELNYSEQIAQNADAKKQLGLMQQQLGLSGDEISARLNNTLAQLGLQNRMNVAQLLGEIGKVQRGEYSPVTQLLGDIYSISGLQIPAGG